MAYKNNHFVPQLILRRFADRINVYDIQEKTLLKNKKLENVFSKNELYSEEIEKLLGQKIESPFAKILNEKILSCNVSQEIELNRKELNIIKKFLLIEQMRVFVAENVTANLERALTTFQQQMGIKYPFIQKEIADEKIKDRWLRNIKVIIECQDLMKIYEHELCTYEVYRWAQIYNSGYLAIWDTNNCGEDFIITDVGMTSEVEESLLKFGFEREKIDFLNKALKKETFLNKQIIYGQILAQQINFHENFYMFSISKNRMLLIINPFFRMYDPKEKLLIPDIWPSHIKERKLFIKNRSEQLPMVYNKPVLSENDKFWYKVCPMKLEDVLYVNMLVLDRVDKYLGFSNFDAIQNSLNSYMNWYKKKNLLPPNDYYPLLKMLKE